MSGKETGFGAPDDLGGYDAGFGSPDDVGATEDTGWGSPSYLVGGSLSQATIADDGGEILTLTGDFSAYAGPYVVELYGDPDALDHPCYGLVQGEGYTCWADETRTRLVFVTPPLQTGTYSIRITGEGGAESTIADALVVVRRQWPSHVYSLRKRFPATVYPTGPQDIDDEPLLDSNGPDATINRRVRAETVKALGEELTTLGGVYSTRLTASLATNATTASVESTYGMQDAGTVVIAGLDYPEITYTGKTATTLTGLTRSAYETRAADLGAEVVDWTRQRSYFENARADLNVSLATGEALDAWGETYGVPRGGSWMTDATYREVIEAVTTSPRGTWYSIFRVCDAWTAQFRSAQSSSVSGATVLDPGGYFQAHHYGRWMRITDTDGTQRVHRVTSVLAPISAILNAGKGPYWQAASYAAGSRSWYLLPFWMERDEGIIRVHVALPAAYAAQPHYVPGFSEATYAGLTPPAPGAAAHPLSTRSGYVLESPSTAGSTLDPAHPFYIGGGGVEALQIVLDDMVADGFRVVVDTVPA